jgi:DNA-binding Lrp family transcriptional regulator
MGNSIQAYVLMDIEIGQLDKVVEQLRLIQEANKIAVVTGHYDIIMRIQVESLEQLYDITVQRIHTIPGIRETTTAVIEKIYVVH